MSGPTTEDTASDLGWNILTGIPGVGTILNGAAVANDLYTMATSDNKAEGQQAFRDLASDGLGMVPLVGTVTGFAGIGYDIMASNDTWGNLTNRLMGGPDKYPVVPNADDFPDGKVPTMTPGPRPAGSSAPAPTMCKPDSLVCE